MKVLELPLCGNCSMSSDTTLELHADSEPNVCCLCGCYGYDEGHPYRLTIPIGDPDWDWLVKTQANDI